MKSNRRRFLQTAAATIAVPYLWTSSYARSQDANGRLRLGMIGCGGKGRDDAQLAAEYGDFVAVCDVHQSHAHRYAENPRLNGDGQRKLDIYTDHRELLERVGNSTISCHLANIALRLGRKVTWNPKTEMFEGDDQANVMLAREQREGYQIEA